MEERFLPEEGQKEERNYLLRGSIVQSHIKCVAFSSLYEDWNSV